MLKRLASLTLIMSSFALTHCGATPESATKELADLKCKAFTAKQAGGNTSDANFARNKFENDLGSKFSPEDKQKIQDGAEALAKKDCKGYGAQE